jgi:glycosyltransferase involved in cell wall biosynthesis
MELLMRIEVIVPLEIPVVIRDNGSSDESWNTIENYRKNTTRLVKATKNQKNLGIDYNIFSVVEDCDTEFVWLLGDDDDFEDAVWEKITESIALFPDVALLYLNYSVWNSSLTKALSSGCITMSNEQYYKKGLQIFGCVAELMSFISCLVIKRESFLHSKESLPANFNNTAVDFVWCIAHMLRDQSAAYISESMIRYRSGDEDRGFSGLATLPYFGEICREFVKGNGLEVVRLQALDTALKRSIVSKTRLMRDSNSLSLCSRFKLYIKLAKEFRTRPYFWFKITPMFFVPWTLVKIMRKILR